MSARITRLFARPGATVPPARLELDAHALVRVDAAGSEERLAWAELREVRIVSRPAPTLSEGVVFELEGASATLRIPRPEATQDLIDRLQQLPGFSTETLIEAIGCAEEAEFVCWRAEPRVED